MGAQKEAEWQFLGTGICPSCGKVFQVTSSGLIDLGPGLFGLSRLDSDFFFDSLKGTVLSIHSDVAILFERLIFVDIGVYEVEENHSLRFPGLVHPWHLFLYSPMAKQRNPIFCSCCRYVRNLISIALLARQVNPPNPKLWEMIRQQKVDFVLHGGDLTYSDAPDIPFSNFLNKELR